MAIVHTDADITPTKLELLQAWVPTRGWWPGGEVTETVGAYRFDDPAGEVGIESILVRAGDVLLHAPLTYRGAPLDGAEAHLITTMEHTVLGRRWIYDACGDPVWAAVVTTTVLTGGRQADLEVEVDGKPKVFTSRTTAVGSGSPGATVEAVTVATPRDNGATTVVDAGRVEIVVARVVGAPVEADHTLTVQWPGGHPTVLLGVRSPRGNG